MSDFEELQEKVRKELNDYVNVKAKEIIERVFHNGGTCHVSTMGIDANGWNKKYHTYMPDICKVVEREGINCTMSVSYQVTDWNFYLQV